MSTTLRRPGAEQPSPRQARTTRAVTLFGALVLAACVGWAVLAQEAVPDACELPAPPPRAQYLHC